MPGAEAPLLFPRVPRLVRDVRAPRYEVKLFMRLKPNVMIGFVMGIVAASINAVDSTPFQASSGIVATIVDQHLDCGVAKTNELTCRIIHFNQ
jgi:hypothetical protein